MFTMIRSCRAALLALAVAIVGATDGATAATPMVLDHVDGLPIAQLGGRVVWNRPQGNHYILMTSVGGAPARQVPTAPSRQRFDVDLGTDATGQTVAIYPRCRAQRCRLVVFNFATGREVQTSVVGPHRGTIVAPTVWRGVVAYGLTRQKVADTEVMIQRLLSSRAPRVIARIPGKGQVDHMDLGDAGLAYAVTAPRTHDSDRVANEIYLKRPGKMAMVIARGHASVNGSWMHSSPSFSGNHLYWTWAAVSDISYGYVVRYDITSGRAEVAALPAPAFGVAADARDVGAPLIFGNRSCVGAECLGSDQVVVWATLEWRLPPSVVGVA